MPDISMVHIDQYLTDYSISYQNFPFIGRQIFKPKFVGKRSNKYPIYGFERFKIHRTDRAVGAASPEMEPWRMSNDLYYCAGKGQKALIDDEVRGNDDGIDIEIETTEDLSDIIWLPHEVSVKNAFFGAGSTMPGTTLSGTAQWSDQTNSNPIAAVLAQFAPIMKAIGKKPNTLIVGWPVHVQLVQHPVIVDRFKFTKDPDEITDDEARNLLKSIFQVENYLVAEALYDTALQGQATSNDFVWGKNAALCYVPQAEGKRIVTIGTTFMWTYGAPGNAGLLVKRWYDNDRGGDWIDYRAWYHAKTVAANAAYTWTNASAT